MFWRDWPSAQAAADPDPATTNLRVEAEKLEAGWNLMAKSWHRFDCRCENQHNHAFGGIFWAPC